MRFELDGKRISRKRAEELVGKERLAEMVKEAKETMKEDPYIENDWWIGVGLLTISHPLFD